MRSTPPGWITLLEAIDRICVRRYQLDYVQLCEKSKPECRLAFREIEKLLITKQVTVKLIANNRQEDFTIFDMHLGIFRINFHLNNMPGIEVARYKDRLSDLVIKSDEFEKAYASQADQVVSGNTKQSHQERSTAFLNLLVSQFQKGQLLKRDQARAIAKSQFSISRKDADTIRAVAARKTGNGNMLLGGRPKK
jgi:hypothetical protein